VGADEVLSYEEAIKKAKACAGSTGPMGLDLENAIVVLDPTVSLNADYCTGANEDDFHFVHFNPQRDFLDKLSDKEKEAVKIIDIAAVTAGDPCPECGNALVAKRGIEIGNIFHLGDKYTKSMNFTYLDQNGKAQHPIMGCYGLGITRALGSMVEEKHDDFGMKLPITIAPFEVHIMVFDYKKKPEVREVAENLYESLKADGVDVLIDDRDKKAGFQFKDADLIGIPVRALVSPKLLKEGMIELSLRSNPKDKKQVAQSDALATIKEMVAAEYRKYAL